METHEQVDTFFKVQRRQAIAQTPDHYGIDFIEVEPDPDLSATWNLLLHFVPSAPPLMDHSAIPPGITAKQISIRRVGENDAPLEVLAVQYPENGDLVLTVKLRWHHHSASIPDYAAYELELQDVPGADRFFQRAPFFLQTALPIDPQPTFAIRPDLQLVAEIDYLAKDYASFRQLMLDHMALLVPEWKERHPADQGILLVEILAYAADYLSYYQDAVATEAYLGTARQRTSVRRHARLLNYSLREGCNARVWAQVQVSSDCQLQQGTPLVTQLPNREQRFSALTDLDLNHTQAAVFETLHPVNLYLHHHHFSFYTWGAIELSLPPGATTATLVGHYDRLQRGDVLIFEERRGPTTGIEEDADPNHRHPVRLSQPPRLTQDPVLHQAITEITWDSEDALPFRLWIACRTGDGTIQTDISLAWGNIVLADAGRTISAEPLPVVPPDVPYLPQLRRQYLVYRVPYDHVSAQLLPATQAMRQNSQEAMPAIALFEQEHALGETVIHHPCATVNRGVRQWQVQPHLLGSDRFADNFVVESGDSSTTQLRFGDGVYGRKPASGSQFQAVYRVGSPLTGNIGAEALAHIVTTEPRITGVYNPLPAQGGQLPESLAQVRINAPQSFKQPYRCVTEADYAAAATQHPQVRWAIAQRTWTGSWETMVVYVVRQQQRPVDERFRRELRNFLEPFRLAGHDVQIAPPQFVPLYVSLTLQVEPHYYRSRIQQALLETFSNRLLADGQPGVFYPDLFTFGQPVYLSPIIARAMQVAGVMRVVVNGFQRWGQDPNGELEAGQVAIAPIEIARLDNDPSAPENGTIRFYLEGGL